MLSNEYLTQCSSIDLIDIVREYEAAFADSAERVAEIEHQLTARIAELEAENTSLRVGFEIAARLSQRCKERLAELERQLSGPQPRLDAMLQKVEHNWLWA